MCGIDGIIDFSGTRVDESDITLMNDLMAHRGPDGTGIWFNDSHTIGLGHRRLSIIDLSRSGSQPMSSADRKTWIVFNGEIYNYIEIKEELVKDGVKFASTSDTEAIIYLYRKYGAGCIQRLRGMFAFCIIDLEKHIALLARDRMGKKPMIYHMDDKRKRLYFCSEIAPLLAASRIERAIDLDALNHYFSNAYFHVPAPYTIFKGVRKLEPACYMKISLKTGRPQTRRYWVPAYGDLKEDFGALKEKYLAEAKETISLRERSDVPVAIMLSGGIDSSTILAMMSRHNVQAFAIGFNRQDPELVRARKVARQFGVKLHEFIFKDVGFRYLPEVIHHAGEPFNLPSALYSMQLCKSIHDSGVKVVMSGNGADEMFCGYDHHNAQIALSRVMRIKKFTGRSLFKAIEGLVPFGYDSTLKQFMHFMSVPDSKVKGELYRIRQKELSSKLYSGKFRQGITDPDTGALVDRYYALTKTDDEFRKNFYCDMALVNAHSMTYSADITGMANSLEIRAPFMDHKFVEFAGSVPNKYKIRSFFSRKNNKYLMRKAAEDFLPKDIVYAKKMGFGYNIRIHDMMRRELRKDVEKRLFKGTLGKSGLFNMDYVRDLFDEHVAGKKNNGIMLMALICFEEWYRQFMKQ